MSQYRTKQNEVLDWICYEHYNSELAVAPVLEANPGLADYGEVLPAGVLIELPVLTLAAAVDTINLWD